MVTVEGGKRTKGEPLEASQGKKGKVQTSRVKIYSKGTNIYIGTLFQNQGHIT